MKKTILVGGMLCSHCVNRVKRILSSIPGITNVEVDLNTSQATFDAENEIDLKLIKKLLEEEGYYLKKK